ncbi:unnamed protein product [Blepharisma stoltei]|uniref:AAA-ATPase-like domain-containing protein n=1 Tax=Blepharisma stoltei TaxID=1481888 RepID=A0AAU9IM53_9CILI|nr:unnamed protein product [Blepharisma stoltei]
MITAEKDLYMKFLQLDDWMQTSANQGYASFQAIKNAFQAIYNDKIHFIDREFTLGGHLESSGNLDFITKIQEIMQDSDQELKIPIVSCWKAILAKENLQLSDQQLKYSYTWQIIVILPKNHTLIDGRPLGNLSELIFLIDSSGNGCQIPENIKSLLKEKINFEEPHRGPSLWGGCFPNAKIYDKYSIKQCINPNESGIWCIFNAFMLISNGNDSFLGAFCRRVDMNQSSKLRAILEAHNIELNYPIDFMASRPHIKAIYKSPKTQQPALKVRENSTISCGNIDFANSVMEDAFVDKTQLIKKILDDASPSILIARPRRWGKTSNMKMLKAFFHPDYDENGNLANLHLFTGGRDNIDLTNLDPKRCLKIMTLDNGKYIKDFGSKPTIFLSFSHISNYRENGNPNIELYLEGMRDAIKDAYNEHKFEYRRCLEKTIKFWCLLHPDRNIIDYRNQDSDFLEEVIDKYKIEVAGELKRFRIYKEDSYLIDIKNAIIDLANILFYAHNKPVLVLVDEYDRPINDFIDTDEPYDITAYLGPLLHRHIYIPNLIYKVIFIGTLKIPTAGVLIDMNILILNKGIKMI